MAHTSLNNAALGGARFFKVVDPSAGAVDLVATYGRPARWISVVDGAGDIKITTADGTQTDLPAMPVGFNHIAEEGFIAIRAGSGETSVILGF